jgi:hypothetical protein
MLGPLTVGRKAAKWGYRKYGLPGGTATGAAGVAGYVVAHRKVRRAVGGNGPDGRSADDPSTGEGSGPSG